jgi:hypothetical protein
MPRLAAAASRCGDEGRLELSDGRTFETHVRLAPGSIRPAIAEPLVIDTQSAGPPNTTVDHDPTHVRTVLREMQR